MLRLRQGQWDGLGEAALRELSASRTDTVTAEAGDGGEEKKAAKYEPYKHTGYWKWAKACKISGTVFMAAGSLWTLGVGAVDLITGGAEKRGYIEKQDKKKYRTAYVYGIAGMAAGVGIYCLSYVFESKARKKVELGTTVLCDGPANCQSQPVPALTLTYKF